MKRGSKITEEHRKKIIEAAKAKGFGLWMIGKRPSLETRMKRSESAKRAGCGRWMSGRKLSDETRKKMSLERKNNPRPSLFKKGHVFPKEILLKNALIRTGRSRKLFKSTPLVKALRSSSTYRLWRSDVFERDNYTCQECKNRGGKILNADHIKPFSAMIREYKITTWEQAIQCKELWNLDNGRTLCIDCHRRTDTFAGGAVRYMNENFTKQYERN